MTQNYANHRHTPTLFLVAFFSTVGFIVCVAIRALGYGSHLTVCFAFLIVTLVCLCLISRRYTTKLQDRIIKMEMRYRTDRTLTPEQRTTLWTLSMPQIVAVRFASDAEMPALIDRAAKEHLSANDIKKAIKDWQADFDRT
jgi:hypothetical protein